MRQQGVHLGSLFARAESCTCPRNMWLTSPSLTTNNKKRPNSQHHAAPRRPTVETLLELLNGGGEAERIRERSSSSAREIALFSTRQIAWPKRFRPGEAETYHSFFRWSSRTKWTSEKMEQKLIPNVINWDEVCTVPRPTLETFLGWLEGRGVQVIC